MVKAYECGATKRTYFLALEISCFDGCWRLVTANGPFYVSSPLWHPNWASRNLFLLEIK